MSRMNDPQQESAVGQVVGQVREQAGKITDAAQEKYEHLRDTATEYYETGRAKAEHWQEELENYVHEQPIKSLFLAAGVGMLLGIIWKHS